MPELRGGIAAGRRPVDSVEFFSHLANIGDVRSLIVHRRGWSPAPPFWVRSWLGCS